MTTDATPVVLVADDEPSMLALVGQHIKTMGYEVLEASDGEQAWALAQEHLPDLVILDVMMPGMSGWEVCRKIREDVALAHTAIIMLTGIGENLNELTSPLYGADSYIDKPFAFPELDEKVRGALTKRQASRPGLARTAPGEGLEIVRNGNGNGNGGHHDHSHGLLASTGTETESEPPHAEAVDEAWSDHEEGSEVTNGADESILLVETSSLRSSRRQHAGKPPSRGDRAARGALQSARTKAKTAAKAKAKAKPAKNSAKTKGKTGRRTMSSKGKAKPIAAKAKTVAKTKTVSAPKGKKAKGAKAKPGKSLAAKALAKTVAGKKVAAKRAIKKPVAKAKSVPKGKPKRR